MRKRERETKKVLTGGSGPKNGSQKHVQWVMRDHFCQYLSRAKFKNAPDSVKITDVKLFPLCFTINLMPIQQDTLEKHIIWHENKIFLLPIDSGSRRQTSWDTCWKCRCVWERHVGQSLSLRHSLNPGHGPRPWHHLTPMGFTLYTKGSQPFHHRGPPMYFYKSEAPRHVSLSTPLWDVSYKVISITL